MSNRNTAGQAEIYARGDRKDLAGAGSNQRTENPKALAVESVKQLEIYQKAADAFNAPDAGKFTIVGETDFGGHFCLPVRSCGARIESYAQYKESLVLYFVKKSCRNISSMRFYGTRPFAIFSGWQTSTFEYPNSYQCFDKNLFYSIVDGIDAKHKICEESERVHLAEIQSREKVYKVVCIHNIGLFESAEQLKAAYESTGDFHSASCRAELQGAPKLKSFCGPMYDGTDEHGRTVIRYESQEVYDLLSR